MKQLRILLWIVNIQLFPVENKELFSNGLTTIVPIIGGGDRLRNTYFIENGRKIP